MGLKSQLSCEIAPTFVWLIMFEFEELNTSLDAFILNDTKNQTKKIKQTSFILKVQKTLKRHWK